LVSTSSASANTIGASLLILPRQLFWGAAATRTKNIRLSSAVTVLSAADPVRVFQEFATLDLLSHGRAEMVAGRGSSVEAYPLFGFDLEDYDSLFSEKLRTPAIPALNRPLP
jgi:alkanesulfonate monooxygenase SsuD/methylene tetrahydromethanopterin reductase-like flavin-dependent oxidoreductase (luciferase family)